MLTRRAKIVFSTQQEEYLAILQCLNKEWMMLFK